MLFAGKKDRRLEMAIDRETDAVIMVLARRLAGLAVVGDEPIPTGYRSEAARQMLAAGARVMPGLVKDAEKWLRAQAAREAAGA